MRMEKVLLTIIAASGLCAGSSRGDREYHFVSDLKTWTEAQSHCREKYTDLVTIDSMEDLKILNDTVDQTAWIGLYDDVDSWRWSLSDRSFYKDGETEFRRWKLREPNNHLSRENCTEMNPDGEWNDVPCEYSYKPVCMNVTGPTVAFILIDTTMNWTEAQSLCRARYTDLASVRNMEDNQKVMEVVPPGQYVSIGLFRDRWKWSDGSNSSFRYWRPKQPKNDHGNEDCVMAAFNSSGEWEDWPCDRKMPFVCYGAASVSKQVMKVRLLKESSSLDLNDPAVMEDILKQLKQKLKDQGLNEGIKLSWRKQPDGKVFHEEEEETEERKARKKREEL